jgi:transposase
MISLRHFNKLIPMRLLNSLAITYRVNAVNQVRLPGQSVFLCILNGILNHPKLTQRMLEEEYTRQTKQTCDHSSFGKRLASIDPEYFAAILAHLKDQILPAVTKGDAQALKLRIVDATVVTLSAKLLNFGIHVNHRPKADLRYIKSVFELRDDGIPDLLRICKEQKHASDMVAVADAIRSENRKGDLWVFDKGCHGREFLLSLSQAGSFFLTPQATQKLSVLKTVLSDDSPLPAEPPARGDDICRIYRVDLCTFDNAHYHRIRDLESMQMVVVRCHRYDSRSKTWKPFVLMTNLPLSKCEMKAGPYTFAELAELYRRRWEIEAFFRLLKEHLSYDHLTSRTENGVQVMVYMAMITVLLLIWYKHQTKIDRGWRSVKFWLAEDIRELTKRSIRSMVT